MQKESLAKAALLGCLWMSQPASAGDRLGVTEAVRTLPAAWPEAFFSIEVKGTTENGDAILNQPLNIEYEAAVPGYVSYLRISSHGDMTLVRDPAEAAAARGELRYVVDSPLGGEQVIVLFSSAPLESLFSPTENSRDVGADRASAEEFVRRLAQLRSSNVKLAYGRYRYVVAVPGGTEYTTRGIILHFMDPAGHVPAQAGGPAAASGVVNNRVASHIQFEFDKYDLTEQGRRDLDTWGDALVSRDLRNCSITLEGHTDSSGTDEHNRELSMQRAQTAKDYLEHNFGIPAARLSATGMGKDNPIAPNDTESNRQQNRRVDFACSSRQ
jgi:outer membrane protein OmpA-like peptidoglycan-associated protein